MAMSIIEINKSVISKILINLDRNLARNINLKVIYLMVKKSFSS